MGFYVENRFNPFTNLREFNHSHPNNTEFPSGLDYNVDKKWGDIQSARTIDQRLLSNTLYNIYLPAKNRYVPYSKDSTWSDFTNTCPELVVKPKK